MWMLFADMNSGWKNKVKTEQQQKKQSNIWNLPPEEHHPTNEN